MNKLNVFNNGYYYWRNIRGWWNNLRHVIRGFKYAYQRAIRGFSDYDCFDLDTYYLNLIKDTLRHLARNTHGYPLNYTEESWNQKLNDLADRIEYILKDNDEDNEYAAKYMEYLDSIHYDIQTRSQYENYKEYYERDKVLSMGKYDMTKKVFIELGEILPDLWD